MPRPPPKFQKMLLVSGVCKSSLSVSPFTPGGGGKAGRGTGAECGFLIRTQKAQFGLYNGAAMSQVTVSLSNSLQKETNCMLKSSTNTSKIKQ